MMTYYYRPDPPGPSLVLAILVAALLLVGAAGCAIGWIARGHVREVRTWQRWRHTTQSATARSRRLI